MPRDRVPGHLFATGEVTIEAAAGGSDGPRRFSMTAYTGGAMRLGGWPHPVVVDLAGMRVTAKSRPVLRDHDPGKIVGHTEEVDIQPKRIAVAGVLSADNLFSREVATSAGNGFPWQASIGASVEKVVFVEEGETATANGRTFPGPVYVARRTTFGEVSFVALGADDATSARLAASAASSQIGVNPMKFEQWVEAKGFTLADLSDAQQTSLRAMFDAEQAAKTASQTATQTVQAGKPVGGDGASAGGGNPGAGTPTLDQIFAARRAEDDRIRQITEITARAIEDRPFMTDDFEKMARTAIEAKSSPIEYELAVLRASRAPATVAGRGGKVDRKASEKVITAALCVAGGLPEVEKAFDDQTLQAAHDRFPHGVGLGEVMLMAARENGFTDMSTRNIKPLLKAAFPQEIQATGFSTFSLSGILGNVANKFMARGFNAVESTWRQIAAVRSVRDFKTITSYSLTGGMMYEKVGPDGELKHATLGEQSYTNKAETYGRMFAITRTDIINDDLDALTAVPMKLGRGGALKLNDVFWTEFLDNATFFTAARGNYDEDTDTALAITGLGLADTLFRNQTDPDGLPLAITPRILLVPNAKTVTASQLMSETRVIDGSSTTAQPASNPFAGMFRVVSSSYLSNSTYTGYSADAWYLLADPADLPVIEVVFLNGRDTPVVESADADFDQLGVQFRGYHDFGVNLQEYRAGVKMAGVNV
jgi:phage major head subunit gpT-like protein